MLRAYPHELSGGQAQRVLLARALVCEPALLVADEPTSALDAVTQMEILSLLRDLKLQHRMGMLFITHNLAAAARIADRLLVMYGGRIVESGPFQQICAAPRHPYTRRLLEFGHPASGKKHDEAFVGVADDTAADMLTGCVFARLCPERLGVCSTQSPPPVLLNDMREQNIPARNW